MFKSDKIIAFMALIFLAVGSRAQLPRMNFTALTSRDGLLSNAVNAILKDRYGLMWFATDDGLNKFDGANFTVYRHVQGDSATLGANEVLALYEDRQGNLWAGTSGGALSRYDRRKDRFLRIPAATDKSGLGAGAVVRGICEDREGRIWIAQFEAPYVLDPVSGELARLTLEDDGGKASARPTLNCIYGDPTGAIWVGTDQGLYLCEAGARRFRRYIYDTMSTGANGHEQVRAIAGDAEGNLWIGTSAGLCRRRPDAGTFTRWEPTGSGDAILARTGVNAIVPDKDGKLWIGTMDGLHIIDPHAGTAAAYLPDARNVHGLTSRSIKSIYIDEQGIYWLGTYRGGVNKYDRNLNLFDIKLSEAFLDNEASSSIVTAFAGESATRIWVGMDGRGLFRFDRRTRELEKVRIDIPGRKAGTLRVLALCLARNGLLYIGTYGEGLLIMDTATGKLRRMVAGKGAGDLNGSDIYSIREDAHGRIWAGLNGQGVNVIAGGKVIVRYTPSPSQANDIRLPMNGYIRAIEEDKDGYMYIGSHGGGMAVLRPEDSSLRVYNQNTSNIPIDKIYSILSDRHGRLWVGTYGGGLCLFDRAKGRFVIYGEPEGLQNTTIYQVVEDKQGRIWVSTNTGISSFDADRRWFRNFTAYNGLQHNNFVHGAGICLADGELLFGGLQGFNYFHPLTLTVNRNVPTVLLTDLQIANRSVKPGPGSPISDQISVASEIHLDYKQNFAISFVALNYTLPKQNQYAYKLDGIDKGWNYAGTMNTAWYTNLDPGSYVFRVKAANNDGVWSTQDRAIRIFVHPPLWRTAYAYALYVLAAAGLLWYSRRRGLARVKRRYELEQERAEARRVQEVDRMKLKFLTNLSHEFRTPISLIMGPVEQLLTEPLPARSRDRLNMVQRNARRLLNLVNQLLDFRKMEVQELKLQPAAGELVAFLRDAVQSFSDLSNRKNIQLHFRSEVPAMHVSFDGDKLERVLFNLLSNAFKFTPAGGEITVEVGERADAPGVVPDAAQGEPAPRKTRVYIRVTDTGVGIPAHVQHRVFDRFFQHATEGALMNQGTGIGLSIARELVRMHGGSIGVDSEVGRGTTFTIHMDLPAAEPRRELSDTPIKEEAGPARPAEMRRGAKGADSGPLPVVLLVEDNEDLRFYLKDNLKEHYKIIEAADGKEGWQKALSVHPHIIVSDVSMPEMDGIMLAGKLKSDKRTSHIPLILLTALDAEEQQLQGLSTGANDYITKPFSFEVLHARISSMLQLRQDMETTYSRRIGVAPAEVEVESDDQRLLRKVVACLEQHLDDPQLSVEFLSREIGMSRSSLYSKILDLTGETPVEYIRGFKLARAALLLELSDGTIAEIAYQTGFATPNYFARAFKQRYQMLPSEYAAQKKKLRQDDA